MSAHSPTTVDRTAGALLGLAVGDAESPAQSRLLRGAGEESRALVLVDPMVGWYGALSALGDELDEPHRCRIDVVARPVGVVGTFRKSRDTRMWFSGPHRFHLVGC